MSGVESARCLMVVYQCEILTTDYPIDDVGSRLYVATCSCGWTSTRQHRAAVERQVVKHRSEAAR